VVTEEEEEVVEDVTDSNLSSRNRSYLTMVRSPCDHRFPGVIHFALLPAWLLVLAWIFFASRIVDELTRRRKVEREGEREREREREREKDRKYETERQRENE